MAAALVMAFDQRFAVVLVGSSGRRRNTSTAYLVKLVKILQAAVSFIGCVETI
jgi:hypothetical protein